jgi:hypothetical protein
MTTWAISDQYITNTKIIAGMKIKNLYHQKNYFRICSQSLPQIIYGSIISNK